MDPTKTKGKPSRLEKLGYMATTKERVSYGTYFVGQNIFYVFLSLFLLTFFTDIGIPPATVAWVTLIVKVWDAVNDPIFGGFVDKVRFKNGKFLPWLRISLIAIPIATILLFAVPSNLSTTVKTIWVALAYVLWDTAYTICDVPIFGLVTTITSNLRERAGFMTIGRMSGISAAVAVMVVVPQIRTAIGGWLPTAILMSVVGVVLLVPICITAKERVKPVAVDEDVSIFQLFGYVLKNKYMMVFYGSVLVTGSFAINQGLSMHFARHALGDEGLTTLIALASLVPVVLTGFFIQPLLKKYDKYTLYMAGVIGTAVLTVVSFIVGYKNLNIYLLVLVLKGIPLGLSNMLMFMFTPDCAEYGMYKSGIDASGVSFSVQTFSAKFTAAIATSLGALVLTFIGFIEGEGAVQMDGFADKLWIAQNVSSLIGVVLSGLLLTQYKLRDKYVQVMVKCNAGEITREEAENLLKDANF